MRNSIQRPTPAASPRNRLTDTPLPRQAGIKNITPIIAMENCGSLSWWSLALTILGALGSIASLYGVRLTYLQAKSAKTAAQAAADAASTVSTRHNREYSITTIACLIETIELVRQYLLKKQYPSAETKMREIQKHIIEIREVPGMTQHFSTNDLNVLLDRLCSDIHSTSLIEIGENRLKTDNVFENLNNIDIFFKTLQAKLKYNSDASKK